eukprot:930130-Amphidinium_carterae.1
MTQQEQMEARGSPAFATVAEIQGAGVPSLAFLTLAPLVCRAEHLHDTDCPLDSKLCSTQIMGNSAGTAKEIEAMQEKESQVTRGNCTAEQNEPLSMQRLQSCIQILSFLAATGRATDPLETHANAPSAVIQTCRQKRLRATHFMPGDRRAARTATGAGGAPTAAGA